MRSDRTPRHAAPKAGAPRHARVGPRSTGMKRRRRRVLIVASLILSLAGALTLSAKALDLLPGETASPPPALLGAWVKGDARQPASQLAATRQLRGVDRTQAGHRAQLRPMGQKPRQPARRPPGRRPHAADLVR